LDTVATYNTMPRKPKDTQLHWIPELIDAEGNSAPFQTALDTLLEESDRGCAVFAAEIVNMELAALLRSAFRDDPDTVKNVVDPLFRTYAPST